MAKETLLDLVLKDIDITDIKEYLDGIRPGLSTQYIELMGCISGASELKDVLPKLFGEAVEGSFMNLLQGVYIAQQIGNPAASLIDIFLIGYSLGCVATRSTRDSN